MQLLQKAYQFIYNGNQRTVKVKKNIAFSFILRGCGMLISLLLVPMTLGYLNETEYGIWLTLSSVVTWINFFDIGLGNGLRNKLAEALAQDDKPLAREYVSTTVALLCLIMGGIFLLFIIINPFLSWNNILNVTTMSSGKLTELVFVTVGFFAIQFVFKFIGIVLLADQKSSLNDLITTVSSLLSLAIIYILTCFTQGNLMYVALAFLASPVIIQFGVGFFLFRNRYSFLSPRFSSVHFRHAKNLMGVGVQFLILQISGLIVFTTSNILISRLWGPEEVTPYNIAFKYFNIITMLFSIVLSPMWSAYTHAYCSGDFDWIKRMMKITVKLWVLSILAIVLMVLFADFAYSIWVGKDIHIPVSLTYIMGIYTVITNWNNIFSQMLAGVGKIFLSLINSIFNAIVFIPLAIYMGGKFGITGITMAMCLVLLTSSFWQPVQCWAIISKGSGQSMLSIIKNRYRRIISLRLLPQSLKRFWRIWRLTKGCPSEFAVVTMTEHIGDIVACEPVARFLVEQKKQKVIWIVNRKFSELLKYNPNIYALIEISVLSDWIYLKKWLTRYSSLAVYDLHLNLRICPQYGLQVKNKVRADITPENYYNQGSLLTAFCLVGGLPPLKMAPRFYLPPLEQQSKLKLPEKYIAIQTTSNEARRCWDMEKWKALVGRLHEYTFVELGMQPTLNCTNCISSYCGKISLLEVGQIIEKAQLFIGIDSSFAHFANAFAKPSVILLGKFATFDYYMPYSGNFENTGIATILHHSDVVFSQPLDEVIAAVHERLNDN